MNPRRRLFGRAIVAAFAVSAARGSLRAAEPSNADALVDASSRLEMLAERVAKLHAQIAQRVLVARSRRALTDAFADFERTLASVAGAARGEARESYALLRPVWSDYRRFALRTPDRETARGLAERNEELAWIAQKASRQLRSQVNASDATSLLFAVGARCASQRLAKLYLLRDWAIPAGVLQAAVASAGAECRESLAALESNARLAEGALLDLRVVDSQYAFLEQAAARLATGKERARELEHIAKSSDHMLEVLDRMARTFAARG